MLQKETFSKRLFKEKAQKMTEVDYEDLPSQTKIATCELLDNSAPVTEDTEKG